MKAIQIKYIGPTNTKGSRLKAFTESGTLTVSRDYSLDIDQQALQLATEYLYNHGWNDNAKITGFGSLPNGDYVATIGSK